MKIVTMFCESCNAKTLHAENIVTDMESASIWFCLTCGTERRPNEPGSPNEPARPIKPPLVGVGCDKK
jgi:RNase P subunit RPR2